MTERADIIIHRVSEEVWVEHARPGLRFRFEQNREEIGQLVTICQRLLDNWDADTEEIAEKMRKREVGEVKR